MSIQGIDKHNPKYINIDYKLPGGGYVHSCSIDLNYPTSSFDGSSAFYQRIEQQRPQKSRLEQSLIAHIGPFRVSPDRSVGTNMYMRDEDILAMYYKAETAAHQYVDLMLDDLDYKNLIQYILDSTKNAGDIRRKGVDKLEREYERMKKTYTKYQRNKKKYLALCEQKVKEREYLEVCRRDYPEFVKYFD